MVGRAAGPAAGNLTVALTSFAHLPVRVS